MFQFTHPGKGATSPCDHLCKCPLFQFTHPGKGATDEPHPRPPRLAVSIHAPWEGCDALIWIRPLSGDVSIHAPWEGCDFVGSMLRSPPWTFQFTHPGKGATCPPGYGRILVRCFNSRTLGRVRHLLRSTPQVGKAFQFTHPGKGATGVG